MSEFPDLVQHVIGYRGWVVEPDGDDTLWLKSTGYGDTRWKPGVNHAECKDPMGPITVQTWQSSSEIVIETDPDHKAPHVDCGCGLYAWHDLVTAHRVGAVVGAVQLWGELAVHRDGVRAEHARIVALGLTERIIFEPSIREILEGVAARYGCDIVPLIDLERAASKYGIRVPDELLPEREPERESEPAGAWQSLGHFSSGGVIHPPGSALIAYPGQGYITLASPWPAKPSSDKWIALANACAGWLNVGLYFFAGHHWYSAIMAGISLAVAAYFALRRRHRI